MAVFAQATKDILNIHNRVINELTDGHRKSAERHRVDRQIECTEHQERDKNGKRNCG